MSIPARKLQQSPARRPTSVRTKPAPTVSPTSSPKPAPSKTRTRSAPSVRTTAARPRPASPPQPRVRARRGFHLAFWILSASVISMIVVGIVALNAMVVNTTYRMESAQQALDDTATAWEGVTDRIGRDKQKADYQAAIGYAP